VQGRLLCDRDPDERRVERQRDERRDRQRSASPVHLGDDHRHAGGPPPEERPLLSPAILHGAETSGAELVGLALLVAELRNRIVRDEVGGPVVRAR
jgi:hypothetical protein